jgi:hypothetical protein
MNTCPHGFLFCHQHLAEADHLTSTRPADSSAILSCAKSCHIIYAGRYVRHATEPFDETVRLAHWVTVRLIDARSCHAVVSEPTDWLGLPPLPIFVF